MTDRRKHEPEGEPLGCGHPAACLVLGGNKPACGWCRDLRVAERRTGRAVDLQMDLRDEVARLRGELEKLKMLHISSKQAKLTAGLANIRRKIPLGAPEYTLSASPQQWLVIALYGPDDSEQMAACPSRPAAEAALRLMRM